MTMATKINIDVPALFRLWNDHNLTMTEVARDLGVSDRHLRRVASDRSLPDRPYCWRAYSASDEELDGEDGGDTLALSPYVQRRIRELKLGAWAE
jgi:transcriptional regulator with XRE-family HTH domain